MNELTKDDFMCQFPNWEHYEEQEEPKAKPETPDHIEALRQLRDASRMLARPPRR